MRRLELARRRTLDVIGEAYGAQLIDTRSMEWRVDAALQAGTVPALAPSRAALPAAHPALHEAVELARYAAAWLAGTAPAAATHTVDVDLGALAAEPRGRWLLGRDPGADIRLRECPQVSRRHAALILRGGRWYLEDLGSANGTRIGARRVTSAAPLGRLLPVRLADVELRLLGR